MWDTEQIDNRNQRSLIFKLMISLRYEVKDAYESRKLYQRIELSTFNSEPLSFRM